MRWLVVGRKVVSLCKSGKRGDGTPCAWIENNVEEENVERKVKVNGLASRHMSSQTCVITIIVKMSLMRDSTVCSLKISLRETVNSIRVLSLCDNIGLNLFT